MSIFKSAVLVVCLGFGGCTHIADLRACQPPQKSPELFSDHVGWDHRTVDDIRCSNAELKSVQVAREKREATAVNR